jgi:hypothetical protein
VVITLWPSHEVSTPGSPHPTETRSQQARSIKQCPISRLRATTWPAAT